jgi:hypothetical protein
MASTPGESVEPARYKLYGVLYHHGGSAGSGGAIRLMFVTLTETAVVEKLGYTSTTKVSAVGTMKCLGAITTNGWTTGVFICCFIVALLLFGHYDLLVLLSR